MSIGINPSAKLRAMMDGAEKLKKARLEQPTLPPVKAMRARRLDATGSSALSVAVLPARAKDGPVEAKMSALTEEITTIYRHVAEEGEKWLSGADTPTVAAYVRRIVRNYDKEGLTAKVRFIARIRSWAATKQLEGVLKYCPQFLMETSGNGPTVATTLYHAAEWWRRHLGVPFPTLHAMNMVFRRPDGEPINRQREAFSPKVVVNLIDAYRSMGAGAVKEIVRLVVLFIASGLRWKHYQTSTFLSIDPDTIIFSCPAENGESRGLGLASSGPPLGLLPRTWT